MGEVTGHQTIGSNGVFGKFICNPKYLDSNVLKHRQNKTRLEKWNWSNGPHFDPFIDLTTLAQIHPWHYQ